MTKLFEKGGLNAIGCGNFYQDVMDYPELYKANYKINIEGILTIFDWYAICKYNLYEKYSNKLGGEI